MELSLAVGSIPSGPQTEGESSIINSLKEGGGVTNENKTPPLPGIHYNVEKPAVERLWRFLGMVFNGG